MKFLADMGTSPKTVSFLRTLEHEASHLNEQGLHRMSDSEILEKARNEGCLILSHDLDFGDLLAAGGARLPTVIIFRLRNMRPERVNLCLQTVITDHAQAIDAGAVVIVSDGGVRIRRLPVLEG